MARNRSAKTHPALKLSVLHERARLRYGGSRAPGRGAEPCPDMRAVCPVIAHKLFGNSGPGGLTAAQRRQVHNFARDVLKALRSVPHAST